MQPFLLRISEMAVVITSLMLKVTETMVVPTKAVELVQALASEADVLLADFLNIRGVRSLQ
jgi:hypothetical protein